MTETPNSLVLNQMITLMSEWLYQNPGLWFQYQLPQDLSVTPQIDDSSPAQLKGSVDDVHLENGVTVSSGTGEILSE